MPRSKPTPRKPVRRRHRPEDAQEAILTAGMQVICTQPYRTVTVDEVMARTALSRPSFYVYFKDLHDLVVHLFERFAAEFFGVADRWLLGTQHPLLDARAAIEGVVATYARHGRFLRAASDATCYDARVDRAYYTILDRLIAAIAGHIRHGIDSGIGRAVDPAETATALVHMTETYLRRKFGDDAEADQAIAVDTLLTIWTRSLYP